MSDVDLTERLPLIEVQKTSEYARLTPKQKLFCSTYIQSGTEHGNYDPVLATRTAFACKSEENARIMSYALMANISIIEVLNLHFRTEPIEAFLKLVDRAIRNKKVTIAQVQALKLKCDILGLANRVSRVPAKPVTDSPAAPVDGAEEAKPERRGPGRPRKVVEEKPAADASRYIFSKDPK